MRKKNGILLLMLFAGMTVTGQVNFHQIHSSEDMDNAWAEAAAENKPVFIDIYATWCGPCKWMDANVFASEAAGEYMNREFINVKMDGESEFGRQFALQAGLTAYPSFFLYNSEQKLMNMVMGAKPWEEFQPVLSSTLEYYPVLELLQNKFESNLLEMDEYAKLADAARMMGKEDYGNAVAGTYREKYTGDAPYTADDVAVLAFYTDPGTEAWEKLTADIPLLRRALGDRLEDFVNESLTVAIEFAAEEGEIRYLKNFASKLPGLTENTTMDPVKLESRAYVYFYHYTEQFDALAEYIDAAYSERKGDHEWLFEAASNAVFLDPRNEEMAARGVSWFEACIEEEPLPDYYYYLGLTQYYAGERDKTIASLEKAKELSADPEFISNVEKVIGQVKEAMAQ